MTTAYIDTIEEGELSMTRDKIALPVMYKIVGVSGTTATEIKVNAANDSNVPAFNAVHPSYSMLRVTEKNVSLHEKVSHVRVTYSTATTAPGGDPQSPTVPVYHISSRTVQETTNLNKTGAPILLGPDGLNAANVSVLRPTTTIRVSRVEVGINPGVVSRTYIGKVNSATWQGYANGYWLCVGIEGNSDDSGLTWKMDYDFELAIQPYLPVVAPASPTPKSTAWNPIAKLIDPTTALPKPSPFTGAVFIAGRDYVEVDAYDSIDFNALNI